MGIKRRLVYVMTCDSCHEDLGDGDSYYVEPTKDCLIGIAESEDWEERDYKWYCDECRYKEDEHEKTKT